ncbi:TetR/AcrR family transcriptional regulator [Actinophytocola sp.]|uniref:TetR/AcrR family transcriptional regulator n=1 Tax=Actinophytocola sp. TaxID=1872138 RepID=UPI002ED4AFD3
MQARRTRARRGEGGRLREELLDAAERLLVEGGSDDALTLRAVAAAAGVSTPSVYLHFADREALLEAVCIRVWGELESLFHEARGDDPFQSIGRFARAYARFGIDHPVQYRVLLMRPAIHENKAAASCFRLMTEAISASVHTGLLHGDPRTLALQLWSAVHGAVSLIIAQPHLPWPADLDQFVDGVVRMAGLGAAVQTRVPQLSSSAELKAVFDAL